MGELLQALPLGRVAEDHRPQLLPVDLSFRVEDLLAELGDDLGVGRLAGLDHLPRQEVGIDDQTAEIAEHPGDGALAAPDPARQPRKQELPLHRHLYQSWGSTPETVCPATTVTTIGAWDGQLTRRPQVTNSE